MNVSRRHCNTTLIQMGSMGPLSFYRESYIMSYARFYKGEFPQTSSGESPSTLRGIGRQTILYTATPPLTLTDISIVA